MTTVSTASNEEPGTGSKGVQRMEFQSHHVPSFAFQPYGHGCCSIDRRPLYSEACTTSIASISRNLCLISSRSQQAYPAFWHGNSINKFDFLEPFQKINGALVFVHKDRPKLPSPTLTLERCRNRGEFHGRSWRDFHPR